MSTMSWVKGVVVTVGLALGGSAMAAGPGPGTLHVRADVQSERLYERNRDRDFDRDQWDDGWTRDREDRFDRQERRMFRLGKNKIAQGQSLQLRGERLLQRARFTYSPRLARQAHRLIDQGEQLEREGRLLVLRARS